MTVRSNCLLAVIAVTPKPFQLNLARHDWYSVSFAPSEGLAFISVENDLDLRVTYPQWRIEAGRPRDPTAGGNCRDRNLKGRKNVGSRFPHSQLNSSFVDPKGRTAHQEGAPVIGPRQCDSGPSGAASKLAVHRVALSKIIPGARAAGESTDAEDPDGNA
jgi:hypothetical protein